MPRSLYAETAQAGPSTPPVEGDVRADVVIVGGGLTGISAALHLAERGVDVRVLESHEVGWGASGRNGGQVNPGLKFDPDVIERDFGAEMGAPDDRAVRGRAGAGVRVDRAASDPVRGAAGRDDPGSEEPAECGAGGAVGGEMG